MPSIVKLLRDDHNKVKKMFKAFEASEDMREKQRIADTCLAELDIHASLEEEVFYPAMRRHQEMKDLMAEADEEHHVAKTLMAEIPEVDPGDEHWEAKFMVLMENVRHHIKEEEGEIFPKAEELIDVDFIGNQFMQAKSRMTGQPLAGLERPAKTAKPARTAKPAKRR